MTGRSTTTEPTLEPCPLCPDGGKPYFTKTVNGTNMAYVGCGQCGVQLKAQVQFLTSREDWALSKDIIAIWNTRSRVSAEVAPVVDNDLRGSVLDGLMNLANASHTELRASVETNKEYTPEPYERFPDEAPDTKHFKFYATADEWAVAERVSGWFQQRIRVLIDKLEAAAIDPRDAPMMTPAQLERAELIAESRGIDLETAQELVYLREKKSAPASPVAPISKDAWSTLVQAGVLPSPVAIRDEAATCVKCGHDAGVDAIGTCLFGISNTDVKTWDCPCHCEFKPATAPPSTLAKAAELFPRSTYKDKRQLADKERFKLNAALNDYLFNNCDHEHDGYPNHLTCRWCALEIIAAIIERCLFAERDDQKSTPRGSIK